MPKENGTLRIGAGASFADDRIDPAIDLAERGKLDYLVFECLAERTIARENLTRQKSPDRGYTPRLVERMQPVLAPCLENGTCIVTNMGAANPEAAGREIGRLARDAGLGPIRCAVVTGDDVADLVRQRPDLPIMETGEPVETLLPRMVSANAYLGSDVICRALATEAPIVVTGRVADPSLFLAPAMDRFGWGYEDWPRIASGIVAGHLLECSSAVSGGCFADPGKNDVADLANVGFPIAEIGRDGSVVITKLDGTGGRVDLATCKEQLLYEIHDPARYVTADCVLDVTEVDLVQVGKNRVAVQGARALPRTDSYKVTVGYHDGFIGEGQVSYAGTNALARAQLASEIVQERLKKRGFSFSEIRVDLIGMTSVHAKAFAPEPYEVRLRIAIRTTDRKAAEAVGFETRALHVNGPYGGGGGSDPVVREILAVQSVLIPRNLVAPHVTLQEAA